MRLRLGQQVNSTDGPFGELADIVVDPVKKAVTHIVVEPTLGYYQSRLVPIWLVTTDDTDELTVQLDEAHVRQLQRVSFSEYVQHEELIELEEGWDIGTEDVVTIPPGEDDLVLDADVVQASDYPSIPRTDCEIRRTSEVASVDGFVVGHVNGFLTDDDRVSAVVTRVGLPGIRHDILVPFSAIATVLTDRVELSITKQAFFDLPGTTASTDDPSSLTPLQGARRKIERGAAKLAVGSRRISAATGSRLTSAKK